MDRNDLIVRARQRLTPEYLSTIKLRSGCGDGTREDSCLIQRERWEMREIAREAGDENLEMECDSQLDACPPFTSPLICKLAIRVQDSQEDWRAACVPLLPLLIGSLGSDALEKRRLHRLFDWSVREAMPSLFAQLAALIVQKDSVLATKLNDHIAALRTLQPIVDAKTRKAAGKTMVEVAGALDRARARARARDLALDLDLTLARARARARDLALALDLTLTLDLDLDLDFARARDLDLARARAIDLTLTLARAQPFPSPVELLRDLLTMTDPQ